VTEKRKSPGQDRLAALGEFIQTQRNLAGLSLRRLAESARVSNPYLSQIERGLYKPSADVLKTIAEALGISREALYARAGLMDGEVEEHAVSVEGAIALDRRLSRSQKDALLRVYREFVGTGASPASKPAAKRASKVSPQA
jgi:transcriptional regulator with XRE-family HTH domain